MSKNEYIEVAVTYLHHTPSAILVNDGDEDIWIPRQFTNFDGDIERLKRDEAITLEVREWMAEERGLI